MRTLKGVGALLLLLVAVVGLPYALTLFGSLPRLDSFTWAALKHALLTPDTGQVLIGLVTVVGWIAWAVFALSVVAELVTVLSRQRIRIQLPGLHATQRVAGTLLVLVIAMLAVTPHLRVSHPTITPQPAPTPASQTQPFSPTKPTTATLNPATVRAGPAVTAHPGTPAARSAVGERSATVTATPVVLTAAVDAPADAARQTSTRSTEPVVHTVRSGDLLWELAERYYDHGPSWRKIAQANDLDDPDQLRVGQKLLIPGAKQQQRGEGVVTVHRGDTLSSIADDQLGDSDDWPDLYKANKDQITDPDLIDVGQVLTIPASDHPARKAEPHHRQPHADDKPTPPPAQDSEPKQTPASPQATALPTSAPTASQAPASSAPTATAPTAGSSATTGAQQGPQTSAEPQAQQSDTSADESADRIFAAPAALAGVGLLLTAGLVTTLRRRRRHQLTRRRPGRRIPNAPRRAMPVETAMRQQREPLTVTALDQALRAIGAHFHAAAVAPPRLSAARISDSRLDLILTEPAPSTPAGITTSKDGLVWTITADQLPTLLATPGVKSAGQPWPAIVTLGRDADGAHILIDLEAAGALTILAGSAEQATAAITGLALELAVSPWAMDIRLTLVGDELCPGLPAALDNPLVRHVDHLDELLDELEDRADEQQPYLVSSATSVGQKRVDPDLADAWSPEIVFVDDPLTAEQAARLDGIITALPRVAIATVTTQPVNDGWRLDISGQPATAHLHPHDWNLNPQLVPAALYTDVLDLIVTTGRDDTLPAPWWNHLAAETEPDQPTATITQLHPPTAAHQEGDGLSGDSEDDQQEFDGGAGGDGEPALADRGPTSNDAGRQAEQPVPRRKALTGNLIDRLPAHDDTQQDESSPVDHEPVGEGLDEEDDQDGSTTAAAVVLPMHPTLRILGPVELLGAAGTRNRVPKRCMEYLGYLLEHPGSSAARIAAAFSVTHETVRTTLSYLRKWLGADADGTPYLPDAYSGGYVLDGRVTWDWSRLQLLVGSGINTTPTANLRQALELVRGRPFADAADQDWAWDSLRTDIQSVIADLAHELTIRSLDRNDVRTARWAATRGLLVDPAAELLLADRVRTEHQAGDTDEVDRLIARITNHARQQGTDLLDDTVDVLRQAVQGRRR